MNETTRRRREKKKIDYWPTWAILSREMKENKKHNKISQMHMKNVCNRLNV